MDLDSLLARHRDRLEDFWGRREHAPRFERRERLFGRMVEISSNHEHVLDAVELSRALFSEGPPVDRDPMRLQIVVRDNDSGTPVPDGDLFRLVEYTGAEDWITIELGSWARGLVELTTRRAVLILARELAEQPAHVSRYLLNTIFTNLLIASGLGMVHATGVLHDDRLVLLLAPHGAGKSTTALRLVSAGYRFFSDSQVYVSPSDEAGVTLFGFPVGRVHLRPDVVACFPRLRLDMAERTWVRGDEKIVVDLRGEPGLAEGRMVRPSRIDLCLLRREPRAGTRWRTASRDEVWDEVVRNSLYYDSDRVWRRNLESIRKLVERAHVFHLDLGTEEASVLDAVERLGH